MLTCPVSVWYHTLCYHCCWFFLGGGFKSCIPQQTVSWTFPAPDEQTCKTEIFSRKTDFKGHPSVAFVCLLEAGQSSAWLNTISGVQAGAKTIHRLNALSTGCTGRLSAEKRHSLPPQPPHPSPHDPHGDVRLFSGCSGIQRGCRWADYSLEESGERGTPYGFSRLSPEREVWCNVA